MKALCFFTPLLLAISLMSCKDDTTLLGGELMPQTDGISTEMATYAISTQSVKTEALLAASNRSYLGAIVDPETGVRTTSSYLAQFHIEDHTTLPSPDKMIKNEQGEIVADSCVIQIHHDHYMGDSLNVMKVHVHELDKNKALNEETDYRTNLDPQAYLMGQGAQEKTVTYTAIDPSKPLHLQQGKQYYRQVNVRLSPEFGTQILRHYYQHPEHFKNSYVFARNVCAGFYFKHEGGVGTMISSPITTLNIFYRQHTTGATGNDTIVNTLLRIGSTEEVIQVSHIDNEIPQGLLAPAQDHSLVHSPAGIHTEACLPLDDILSTTHYNDTINSAKFVLQAQQAQSTSAYLLPAPQLLLLLPKAQAATFFQGSALPDGMYSHLATYENGGYTYHNIAALLSALRIARDQGANILPSDSPATRQQKWKDWETQHPDWNKVVILPVAGDYSTASIEGKEVKTLQRLRPDFSPTSVRLQGGTLQPIPLTVVYSRFHQ